VAARILSSYLDALKRASDSDPKTFATMFEEDSPARRLMRGEFRRCVPVLGDDPCLWAFGGPIQQGWIAADDGLPVTSPWECWFLDVRAPSTISWASGSPEVPWDGPEVWGWMVTQGRATDGGWNCFADLVLPHDRKLYGPKMSVVKEWRLGWTLNDDGVFSGPLPRPTVSPNTLPFWRKQEEAERWSAALAAPLFRTLQLLNCEHIEVAVQRPPERKRKKRRGKRRRRTRSSHRPEVAYRVLQLEPGVGHSRRPGGEGGPSSSEDLMRRRHLRRGHYKRWGYHTPIELEDGSRSCAKCGDLEADLCGTGHFGTGRKLVKWINQTTVGSREAGELEKMYSVVEHDSGTGKIH
jgi:hypothetical protein